MASARCFLGKTGTITFGNRRCSAVYAAPGAVAKS